MAKEKHLFLDDDAFFVKGERFSYNDITETEFFWFIRQMPGCHCVGNRDVV